MQELQYKPFQLRDFAKPVQAMPAEQKSEEPEEPPVPSFNEAELQAAQREAEAIGYEKGKAAGRRETESENARREEQLSAVLEAMLTRMDSELEAQRNQQKIQKEDMTRLVMTITRKLAGDAMEQNPLTPVETMLEECLTMLAEEKQLAIHVAADLAPLLEARVKARAQGNQAIMVVADAAMQVGDCKVKWSNGEAERDHEALWKEIEKIVNRVTK